MRCRLVRLLALACALALIASGLISHASPAHAEGVSHPEWSWNASIYEVNVRQYTSEGTFEAFARHLPRLKAMGATILWFMPIHPIGELKRKGTLGSYYSVKDYYGINPEFGTLEDFKKLVGEIHEAGMYVIIDWVSNHCAWDNPLVSEHPDWFTRDAGGNLVSPVPDWSDVVDFDYSNRDLWDYMIRAMRFWVEEVGVDGFRCDVAGMVPLEYWEAARRELERIKPVFMLAEWEAPEAHRVAFDATYGWKFYHLMLKVAKGVLPASAIGEYLERESASFPPDAYRLYFTSNHDENSWNGSAQERFGAAATAFAVLSLTLDGIPLIYGGQEAGLDRRLAFFEKDEIGWREHELAQVYTRLLHLKQANPALWNGLKGARAQWIHTSDDRHIFAFIRRKDDGKVLVIVNLSDREIEVTLEGKSYVGSYWQVLPINPGANITFAGNDVVSIEPWGYRVYAQPVDGGLRLLERAHRGLTMLVQIAGGSYRTGTSGDEDTEEASGLEVVAVTTGEPAEGWLYLEEDSGDRSGKRRHLYRLLTQDSGLILAKPYAVSETFPGLGDLREMAFWGGLSPDSLRELDGCALVIKRTHVGVFEAKVLGDTCGAAGRGGLPFISAIEVTPKKITIREATLDSLGRLDAKERVYYKVPEAPEQ